MSFETIRVAADTDGIATITLNRPDKHHAMNAAMIAELTEAAAALGADARVQGNVYGGGLLRAHPFEIAAGAEARARGGEDDRAHGRVGAEGRGGVGQLGDHPGVHRVVLLGPVERDGGDAVGVGGEEDRLEAHGAVLASFGAAAMRTAMKASARSSAARSRPVSQPPAASMRASGTVETLPLAPGA